MIKMKKQTWRKIVKKNIAVSAINKLEGDVCMCALEWVSRILLYADTNVIWVSGNEIEVSMNTQNVIQVTNYVHINWK